MFMCVNAMCAIYAGPPYVCSYHLNSTVELRGCIQQALDIDLMPYSYIPADFEYNTYVSRVKHIFGL